ncbi:hypothetical protein NDU88_000866 [Pleurodeles waltl]|uniref:Nudix hydrolase domain-containing protein n=2 Tax=Pleurodeles waltl TaxID=8319 RepID=A0AAV7LXK4_PLEWA|nr:hypothetical protein NDU88_000866 [Pleurodeles waltl]
MNSFHLPGSSKGTCSTFLVDGQTVGSIPAAVVKELHGYPEVFTVYQDSTRGPASCVELNTKLSSYDLRSAAVHQVLEDLRSRNLFQTLREWRDERYEVMPQFSDRTLMNMERAATPLFGVKQYGVHVNGYFWRGSEPFMWIARRSLTKPTYPGLLDNLAAGGISTGMGIKETLIKECQEEACIPEAIAARAKPVGSVSYTYESVKGIYPECQFVYDLELPQDFVPRVGDGEVQQFYLWPMEKVKETIATTDFKPNCALVVLDFLVRHGFIDPDQEPYYLEFVEGLHQAL